MTVALIIALAFIYTLIALRLQATQVIQPNFLESCGMVLWPIMFIVGLTLSVRVKVLAWLDHRRDKKAERHTDKMFDIARRKM